MEAKSKSTMFIRILLLFGHGFNLVYTQKQSRSFCTGITMPQTRLCDDNLPIIKIVEVSQYEFTGDESPSQPCVYSDKDCGRVIRHDTQLYRDILTHCDGKRTCGGFRITALPICSGRPADYMVINFRCKPVDIPVATIGSSTSIMPSSSTVISQEMTTPRSTTRITPEPTTQTTARITPTHTAQSTTLITLTTTSATSISPSINPPTSSGVKGDENETETDRRLYAGVAGGGLVAVILIIVVIVVCIKRKKRLTQSESAESVDKNDDEPPAYNPINFNKYSSRPTTPDEKPVVLQQIVTDTNANEGNPVEPTPERRDQIPLGKRVISQYGPRPGKEDSHIINDLDQNGSVHLPAPTDGIEDDWGYSSVGSDTRKQTHSSEAPNYGTPRKDTFLVTNEKAVDNNHTIEPGVYATVRKDKSNTTEKVAPGSLATREDDYSLATETDVYATVQKDRDANELEIEENPLYVSS